MFLNNKNGEIIVHGGTMFSGKTSALLADVRKCSIAGLKIGVFKPIIDGRYSKTEIVNHDGSKIPAIPVNSITEVINNLNINDYDVIAIDEFQFIDLQNKLEDFIKRYILMEKRKLIISGLEIDSDMKVFDNMRQILPFATEVHKHKAICMECFEPAYIIHCTVPKDGQILVGGSDIYKPLCPNCYFKHEKDIKLDPNSVKSLYTKDDIKEGEKLRVFRNGGEYIYTINKIHDDGNVSYIIKLKKDGKSCTSSDITSLKETLLNNLNN